MKLGKAAPKAHPKTLALDDYTSAALTAPPAFTIPGAGAQSWPMYGNDEIGDCTEAGLAHLAQAQAATLGRSLVFNEADIVAAYSAVSGYDPATGANDEGAAETDVLAQWQSSGVGGHKILAWAAINHVNRATVMAGCYWLGGLYIGLNLPITAQGQTRRRQPWDVISGAGPDGYPGSWGGHAINIISYDPDGLTGVTWGTTQRLTWAFWETYCDEAYVTVTDELVDQASGKDFAGLNLARLLADARRVAGR